MVCGPDHGVELRPLGKGRRRVANFEVFYDCDRTTVTHFLIPVGLCKVTDFDQIRNSFSPTSVQKWMENVEKKWLDLKSLVEKHGPEYLAAMQLLMAISLVKSVCMQLKVQCGRLSEDAKWALIKLCGGEGKQRPQA